MAEKDDAASHRKKIIGIWFWSLALLSVMTWILIPHLPTQRICYFRDIWLLRSLWFQNLTVFDQFKSLGYSNSEQCVFFATRSLLSLYFAAFVCVLVRVLRSDRERPALSGFSEMALITVFLMSGEIFLDGFDDQFHGYRSWMTYRTYDSLNLLIEKSLFRIIIFYLLATFWAVAALDWHRDTDRGDRQ